MKKKVGRPSSYTPEIQSLAEKYVREWEKTGDAIPSTESLCVYIRKPKSTVYDWANPKHPSFQQKFSETLEEIQLKQKIRLLNGGLLGELNSNIVKLALGNHGMSDKQVLTGENGKDLIPSTITVLYE